MDTDDGHAKGHGGRRVTETPVLHVEETEGEEAVLLAEVVVTGGETHEGMRMNHEEAALALRWEESGGCSASITLGGSQAHLSACSVCSFGGG
jgi:hypothetical protein